MSKKLTMTEFSEDLSGVYGDGLGEGEMAFEGEELLWEEEYWIAARLLRTGQAGGCFQQTRTPA